MRRGELAAIWPPIMPRPGRPGARSRWWSARREAEGPDLARADALLEQALAFMPVRAAADLVAEALGLPRRAGLCPRAGPQAGSWLSAAPSSQRKKAAERRGRRSELWAALLLMAKGYRILGRRVRTHAGEIDLIARAPSGLVCFIEVKARRETLAAAGIGRPAPAGPHRPRRRALSRQPSGPCEEGRALRCRCGRAAAACRAICAMHGARTQQRRLAKRPVLGQSCLHARRSTTASDYLRRLGEAGDGPHDIATRRADAGRARQRGRPLEPYRSPSGRNRR